MKRDIYETDIKDLSLAWVSDHNPADRVLKLFTQYNIPFVVETNVELLGKVYLFGVFVFKHDDKRADDLTDQYLEQLTRRPMWFINPRSIGEYE